ncbi:MAG: transcriptional regulator, partial [Dermatophilaceae bacterium]|nr:transcriptional regulator [Dermatophilaceae bacterium]
MPTDPSTSGRPGRDDAYVVDTRRRVKGNGGGAIASGPGRRDQRGDRRDDLDDRYDDRYDGGRGRPAGRAPRYRWRKGRIVLIVLLVLLLAWIGFLVWVPMQAWGAVAKVDNIPSGERPTDTSGHNYLLVGSDSREGLTQAQKKKYATGSAEGKRTDTIMLVHVSESGGKPVMVSLPRDSYVPIPGHGSNKINAAYA